MPARKRAGISHDSQAINTETSDCTKKANFSLRCKAFSAFQTCNNTARPAENGLQRTHLRPTFTPPAMARHGAQWRAVYRADLTGVLRAHARARAREHIKNRASRPASSVFPQPLDPVRVALTVVLHPVQVILPALAAAAFPVRFLHPAKLHGRFGRALVGVAHQRSFQQVGRSFPRPRQGLAWRAGVARRRRARRAWLRPGRYSALLRLFHIAAASSRALRISSAIPKSTSRRAPS